MAGIFPPAANGGKPPGVVCNGYTPTHNVVGEGPLYFANDCSTVLPDCWPNTVISEMLALVDELGFPWNAARVDNIGAALLDTIGELNRRINARVLREGDTMEGPLLLARDPQSDPEAATKRYVDAVIAALNTALRVYIDAQDNANVADLRQRINNVDAAKINRAGDTMAGPLILSRQPIIAMEATPKSYVDQEVAAGGGGGGGGPGGIWPDAPYDNTMYGRINQTWQRIIDDGTY